MTASLVETLANIALLLVSCWTFAGIGLLVLRTTAATFASGGERLFFAFGVGASVTSFSVFGLAAAKALYPIPLFGLCALLLGLAAAGWWKSPLRVVSELYPEGRIERGAAVLAATALGALLIMSLAPETGTDALTYHLAAPKLFLQNHGFYFIEGNVLANSPFHTEMLYLLALFLKGDVLAKLLNLSYLVILLLGMHQFARHRMGHNRFPWLSALIFLLIPTVFKDAHAAYVDLAVSYAMTAALFAFVNWHARREPGWLLLCAAFSGIALSSKYTTLILPFIGVFGVLWVHRRTGETGPLLRDMGRYLAVLLVLGTPYHLKNWLTTGNPFYPFLYNTFGGRGWEPEQARLYEAVVMFIGMGRGLVDYLLLPWNISVRAEMNTVRFDGMIGPLFLLVLPFLAGMKKHLVTGRILMVYGLVLFMFWASSSQQLRFLMPVFPLLSLLSGYVITHYRSHRVAGPVLAVIVAGCLLLNGYHDFLDFRKTRPERVVFGMETRQAYLDRTLAHHRMYRFVNENLPPDANVYLVYMKNWSYLCERQCYSDYFFEHYTLKKILAESADSRQVHRRIRDLGFSHLMYDSTNVTGVKSLLTPEEVALFRAFQEEYLTLEKQDRSFYLYRL